MIISLYIDAFKYDVSCFACNKYYQIPDDPPDLEKSSDVDEASKSNEKLPKKLTLLRWVRRIIGGNKGNMWH